MGERTATPAGESEATGLRGIINRKPWVALLVIGAAIAAMFFLTNRSEPIQGVQYSVDDGKTFFVGEPRATPFEHEGKEAVRAMICSCDGGKTTFVGYLMRYKPEARAKVEAMIKSRTTGLISGAEVKRPGDKEWVSDSGPVGQRPDAKAAAGTRSYQSIVDVKCPDGSPALFINPE